MDSRPSNIDHSEDKKFLNSYDCSPGMQIPSGVQIKSSKLPNSVKSKIFLISSKIDLTDSNLNQEML
jgi:hypothetical protein